MVEGHQPARAHGGGGLESHHFAGALPQAKGFAAQPHGPTGNQGDGLALAPLAAETGSQIGDHHCSWTAGAAPQQACAHLDHPAHGVGWGCHQPRLVPTKLARRSSSFWSRSRLQG